MSGDVGVVIPCFNYGRFLKEAIDSVTSQSLTPAQIVVVDDGSTDQDTLQVLDELPACVELIRQRNQGVCAARNAGLRRLKTRYLLALDADDRLAVGALAALLEPLEDRPQLGFTYGYTRFFGDWEGIIRFPPYDPYKLLYRHIIGPTGLMRSELVADTAGFDGNFPHYEDWEFWVNALAHNWRGERIEAVTFEYRRHGPSKHGADREHYRRTMSALKRKHKHLYAKRWQLAREGKLGLWPRLVYWVFWGMRPVPRRLESFLHRLAWGRKKRAAATSL